MSGRYAIRFEIKDGTLEDAILSTPRKSEAIKMARRLAKRAKGDNTDAKVWVDDTKTDLLVTSFAVPHP